MGGFRIRWPFTIIWTAVCLWAIDHARAGCDPEPVSADCLDVRAASRRQIAAIAHPAPSSSSGWSSPLAAAWLWTWATRIRCPRCRYVVEPPVRFCPNCGYDLLEDV